MRAVIYARYSSDRQSEASIEDQVRLCRERIEREGWVLVHAYADPALSGASALRPQYQALLEQSRKGAFDIVVAEALDRLSRDQEDVAALYKHLSFSGIRILTLAEGEISELHVGLKGTMNALFLKDLAQKTRRGLEGRVRKGFSGGGKAFGYDIARETDAAGEPLRGKRCINEAEAEAVRRIFKEFAAGHSPRAIARSLNKGAVPGPDGKPWQDTTIRGHATRRTGILRNDLYAGKLVWNKQQYRKDPHTGRRLARPNPSSEWIIEDVPDLRIVDDALWQAVQSRLDVIRSSDRVVKARSKRFWEHRRARHLLTGLVFCHECGSPLTTVGKDYLACGKARRSGACGNRRSIKRAHVEETVLSSLKNNLMKPALVEEFIRGFHEEVNRHQRILEQDTHAKRRRLGELTRRLDGLYEAIAEGLRTPGLKAKLEGLEAEKSALAAQIEAAPPPAPRLHPNLAALYRRKVESLHAALDAPESRTEAAQILRGLIERIAVRPLASSGFEIELIGEIARMIDVALAPQNAKTAPEGAVPDAYRSSVKVVAGTGFEPVTFRL